MSHNLLIRSSVGSWSVSIDAGAGKTINDAGQGNRYFQIVETDSINISAKCANKNTIVYVSLIKDGKVIKYRAGKDETLTLSHGVNCR
ncbi:MAG: hypothetical protein LBG92_10520 [Prevotellaceae bacterium]|nr:hypothetical protein [Prevotellaceae bacterium]